MSFLIGLVASSKRGFKAFTDLFTRSNGSLGSPWKNIRGTWSISSNTTTSSDSASSYPIATIDVATPTSQTLVANVSPGAGIALWVSDSGNWWGVHRREQNFSTFVPQTCSRYVYAVCSAPGYCECCPQSSCSLSCPPGYGQFFFNSDACTEYCVTYYYGYDCPTFYDCSYNENYDCSYTTSGTNRFLTLIRSISNTVSTIANASVSGTISTIKATITGTSLSAIAYSDTNMTNNIGSINQTISSPAPRSGIILSSSDNQGNSLTKFSLS
jgi:hypothetical protein